MKRYLIIGCAIFAVYVIAAIFAPALAPFDPMSDRAAPHLPPSRTHLLGTNDIGRDIFSELLIGTRRSLIIGFLAAGIALTAGAAVGIISGVLHGSVIDGILRAVSSFFMTVPFFPLVIVLSALVVGGAYTPAVILGLLGWPETSRLLRAQTISLLSQQYIQDIRAMGASRGYLLMRHVPRELFPLASARFILAFRAGVLAESTLSFLGLGAPTALSWGNMLYFAQARHAFLTGAWRWWVLPPGFVLAVLVFALFLMGYYFEEAANPRLEAS